MQSEIRSSIAFLTDVNVTTCFQHRLFYITRRRSPVHSIQLINTYLHESSFALFLIVHHKDCFPSLQHKVVCKLLLIPICRDGRPSLLSSLERWPVRFARPPHLPSDPKESSIFCTASLSLQLDSVQDTHVCVSAVATSCDLSHDRF